MYLADLSNVNKMSVPLILSTREFASLHRDLGTSGEGKYKLDVGAGRPPGTYAVCFYLYSPVAKRQPESVEIEIMTAFGTAEYAQHKLKKDQQGDFVSLTAVQESVNSLKELWSSMVKIKGEGAYLLMKDRRARRTSESTFSRIWTSTIVVVLVVVGSVYSTFAFTKRTLKKRRLV
ncbi:COP-coated vesicle membrane protein erv25 precursor [Angomonas deanei]|uniref:Emp24/gp25L/p24 family/GOLD, putative n=1 Tax=Angomonas deanei TaxID=59799 RepID=A0A7G2CBR7_9TRYP|nr:COP-coated vesicle membrane protein erv25 precursor [Angomonas deanei]CAD2216959.1 emp24/gp25L/p24 family/GOLD, putative [Angomonas deanei]|eukprot:EPY20237.1 COP-coated vesicle membrane protein erv25 precursor [Angomonas deanei]